MKRSIILAALVLSNTAYAQLTDAYRRANAVAYYDFAETSGRILDKSAPRSPHAQVDLEIYSTAGITRLPDPSISGAVAYVQIGAPNIIRSVNAASKITATCKASGALSYEVWLENQESVERRAGFDSTDANNRRPHPLRILNLARRSTTDTSTENLYQRNFVFGQFYEMGNIYQNAVRTGTSEPNGQNGRSLTQPLESTVAQTIVPNPAVGRENPTLQKVVYTLGPSGVARLYLSDLNGRMYQATEQADGFLGSTATPANYFANWFDDAYLTLGNLHMRDSEAQAIMGNTCDTYQTCSGEENGKNRFWKGKLRLVAVYCNELSREQVLGAGAVASVIQNATNFTISIASEPDARTKRALDIFQRLTGVKTAASDPIIGRMVDRLAVNDGVGAAAVVTTEDSRFLNIVARDFAAVMSNRDQSVNTPLNDFIATFVGGIRDEIDARRLLYDNITYTADSSLAPVPSDLATDILTSNTHYQALDDGRYDLGQVLVQRNQQFVFNGTAAVANPSPAGVLTSRQWLMEHAIAGTNRRLVEYAFKIFLCTPIESVADASGPEEVIGPDIDRIPGGSATKFQTSCRACHTILDGFRPAFSRWTFGNNFAKHSFIVPAIGPAADENAAVTGMQIDPAQPRIAAKYNRNSDVYPDARRVTDERWVNNAIYNANAVNFKFDQNNPQIMRGSGAGSFGRAIASSPKFARCMADRVFKQVCKRDVINSDATILNEAATQFASATNNYNLKFLFQKIVTSENCLGGQ